jgi:uncharacterized cupredoxin-like copper-binding protein
MPNTVEVKPGETGEPTMTFDELETSRSVVTIPATTRQGMRATVTVSA